MGGRARSWWFDEDRGPMVGWSRLEEHEEFEDDVIARLDTLALLRRHLTPAELHALTLHMEGYQLSTAERKALQRARERVTKHVDLGL